MKIPKELIPYCPVCGKPMNVNLRADDTFVEDAGWQIAAKRHADFLTAYKNSRILFLELGIGENTPGIIKYPFQHMTAHNPQAIYACINYGEAFAPKEIEQRSICIDGDIGEVITELIERH